MTSWTTEGLTLDQIASRNRRWLRLVEYGFRAEQGSNRRTRAEGGFAYRSRIRRRDRKTAARVSDGCAYASSAPPATGVYGSTSSYARRSMWRTTAVFHGAFASRRSTCSRSLPCTKWLRTSNISRYRARSLCARRPSDAAHAGQPHASRSASAAATAPSAVWNRSRVLSSTMRLESTTSIPAYTRMDRLEGVARPVTATTFDVPSVSRTLRIMATNSRGDRSNSGPFARKTASAVFADGTSDSPVTIAKSPATISCGISRPSRENGVLFVGGRSSGWAAGRGA